VSYNTLSVPSLIFWVRPSSVSRIRDPSSSIPLVMPVTVLSWWVTWTWRGRWIQLCHHSSSIDDGLSISLYLDMVWSAIVFRSLRRSYFVPVVAKRETAPVGSCVFRRLTFKPIPTTTKDARSPIVLDSMSIPPSFPDSMTRSFGHLSRT